MAVNESNTIQYTVTTTNTADGTTLYWKTTGNTTNADIVGGNTGSITITNNQAIFNVTISNDANTDGPKTLGITILTGSVNGTPVVNTDSTILINDTSLTPILGFSSVPSSINEGSAGTFNVTSSLSNGSTGYWTINNVTSADADFSAVSGSFTVTGGVASFTVTPSADSTTEGTETFTVSLRIDSISGAVQSTSSSITINDTSLSPANRLYAFGTNNNGRTGLNLSSGTAYSPIQVGILTDWLKAKAGGYQSGAIKQNNTLWLWGSNNYREIHSGDTIARSSPVQVGTDTWSDFVTSFAGTVAIKTNGTMWAWGPNTTGFLGQNDVIERSSPVQIGALTNWSKVIASGQFRQVAAIKTDNTLWTWGQNLQGSLGHNDNSNKSSPVQVGGSWSKFSFGYFIGSGIKTNGTLWLWGRDAYGMLCGLSGASQYLSSPVQLGASTDWSKVEMKAYQGVATKTNGTIWTWGRNNGGQLGLGNQVTNKSSPTQIGALTNWTGNIAVIDGNTLAIKGDGTLWGWGDNAQKIGLSYYSPTYSPVQVGTGTNWTDIYGNYNNFLGITSN